MLSFECVVVVCCVLCLKLNKIAVMFETYVIVEYNQNILFYNKCGIVLI